MTVYIFPPFNIDCPLFILVFTVTDPILTRDYIPDFEVGFSLAVMTRLALSLLMLCHYDQ